MHWWQTEGGAYWAVFVASFLGVAIWESIRPWRELSERVERRWVRHGSLLLLSYAASAILIPASPILLAASLQGSRYGLLNRPWLGAAPRWIVAILLLDLARYGAHRAMHAVPILWRVHHVHHSDPDFDVSTSVRAHPMEVLFLQLTALATVAILVPPVGAVSVQQLLSVFETFFSHANTSLPRWIERVIGALVYTPDAHRMHHAVDVRLQMSNYGDIFPWWDRLLGTYTASGRDPGMPIGVEEFQRGARPGFWLLLKQPFAGNRQ